MSYHNVYCFSRIESQASTDDAIYLHCWRPLLNANFPEDFDIDAHNQMVADWCKDDYMSTNWIDVLFNPDSSSRIPLDVSKHHIVSRNLPEDTDQVQFSLEPSVNWPGLFNLGGHHGGFHFLLPVANENNPSVKRLYFAKLTEDEQLVYLERQFWNNTYRKRKRIYIYLLWFFSSDNYEY
jgi:hypothetical protein